VVQIHSPRPLLNLQHKPHTFFHDGPLLPWHRHLLAGLIQPGGVNHVSGTFCIGKIRTLTRRFKKVADLWYFREKLPIPRCA